MFHLWLLRWPIVSIFPRRARRREVIELFDVDGNKLDQSEVAARKAIGEIVFSRVAMASPGMSRLDISNT